MSFRQIASAHHRENLRYHNGLPDGWNRDRFRQLCVCYAQIRGASAQCIRTLEIIIDMISPCAFRDPSQEPFCYARQETLIAGRGLTDRTIHNHERELEAIGLIERRLGANGARCKRKGLGLFLTPALNLIPEMRDADVRSKAEKKEHDALRGDRSRLYRYVKHSLAVLASLPCPPEGFDELMARFRSWPRADKLKYMSVDGLRSHVQAVHDLWKWIEIHIAKPGEISGEPEACFGCHIQDQIEEKILSCNVDGEATMPSAKTTEPDCSGLESNHPAVIEPRKAQKLPRVNNRTLYELASSELRMHIDIAGGGDQKFCPTLYAIETGVWSRLSEIGTNISAWHAATDRLTLMGAILAGVITDARLSDPKLPPVVNPGGYLRGMVQAEERGDLNLIASFMGLLARRAREEEQALRSDGAPPANALTRAW
ncbi:helix-turn-helix domain-containing protein [Ruegeria sp. HKCCSP351]|uniref:helix-turn-helix domain-containing protein n=1 Tax=Ruegeria sp. HKCCSP351 TaxID=2794832 RepID=UPI001AEB979F|nr:helix-turn-helix domain-containing protein [Ruegeria sp. HKCCSP351]